MKNIFLLVVISVITGLVACKREKTSPGDGGGNTNVDCSKVTFSGDILPLISSRCATSGCHNAGSINGPGPLTTYLQISTSRTFIINAVLANRMPQTGPALTATEKAKLNCWVDAGAPNN
ncbi:MAG: hypothetical protein K2X48_11760 [Chitinophagaceae bacterium]|nr:hypothetical protein [Chitinophagaceae bacterium]